MHDKICILNKRLPLKLFPGYGDEKTTPVNIDTETIIIQEAIIGFDRYKIAEANMNTAEIWCSISLKLRIGFKLICRIMNEKQRLNLSQFSFNKTTPQIKIYSITNTSSFFFFIK